MPRTLLPFRSLLSLVSVGAVGWIALSCVQFQEMAEAHKQERQVVRGKIVTLREACGPFVRPGWNYSGGEFWLQFSAANFTGKAPKVPEDPAADAEAPEERPENLDLNEVLRVIAITHGRGVSSCVVDYKTSVTVPDGLIPLGAPGSLGKAVSRGRTHEFPRAGASDVQVAPPQHLKVGEALWKPFDHVVLCAVHTDAESVIFELRGAEAVKQELVKSGLDLPPEIAAKILAGRRAAKATSTEVPNPPASPWVDRTETTIGAGGRVNIGTRDERWFADHGAQIFREEVQLRDYRAGSGEFRVRGVQFRKISPRARKFGIAEGDVLLAINNESVRGMAHARRLGRRMYRRGARSFKLELLRRGERITLRYAMPPR